MMSAKAIISLSALLAVFISEIHRPAKSEEVALVAPEATKMAEKSGIRFEISETKDGTSSNIPSGWNIIMYSGEAPIASWNCGRRKPLFGFVDTLEKMRKIINESSEVKLAELSKDAGVEECQW